MRNLHFINVRTGKHEITDMKVWCLMFPNSLAALQITTSVLLNLPVAFSAYGSDGDGYIMADDESVNDPFFMAHEEGHLELGHFRPESTVMCDEFGVIDDVDAEKEADKYAVEKTKDPKHALEALHKFMDRINVSLLSKEKRVKVAMDISERMLAISNMDI